MLKNWGPPAKDFNAQHLGQRPETMQQDSLAKAGAPIFTSIPHEEDAEDYSRQPFEAATLDSSLGA